MKIKYSTLMWMAFDFLMINLCLLLSIAVSANFDHNAMSSVINTHAAELIICLNVSFFAVAYCTNIYRVLWSFAGTLDYLKVVFTSIFSGFIALLYGIVTARRVSINIYIVFVLLFAACLGASRLGVRVLKKLMRREARQGDIADDEKIDRIMIIGAGDAANLLISDMYKNVAFRNSVPICAIDDDPKKRGKYLNGIRIAGDRKDIIYCAKKYHIDTIVFAIPSMDSAQRAEILKLCSETGCKLKSMPPMDVIINNSSNQIRLHNVEIEDLLDRVPIKIDVEKIMNYVENKVILVTGGGGSIGSELCRQIARHHPKRLIIFDVYENNAYDILNELSSEHPELDVLALIGSVRDSKRMECLFRDYRPQIVYHAAAHKHVPLMEDSPNEAIKNNVFGTYKTASMADKYGAERFVLISTDKAVNPTNVMGASKRMCEMIVQSFSRRSKTEFVAVRFGNVLGSNGSVIPLFKKQIEAGGPVLVTHPDIIRYFMTIPEAVSLVLTAGAMAKGGEIFVLDMGRPVKIVDLAKNMIKLMGYEVDRDIKIKYIGLRPGEKLFEEMLMDEEGLRETENHLIHIGTPIEFDEEWFRIKLSELKTAMYDDSCDIRNLIHEIVTTYKVPAKYNNIQNNH